ncbi:uncharacterized protein LOC115952143 [Quercus lobata]|uniref:uncharacterized protein LOC115952143 n=1 Tax=Quercus lobata TaxID=97700 RepID=UPI0012492BA5|nr:uncharacterized protein LOC115952143 [Quercus lobata]
MSDDPSKVSVKNADDAASKIEKLPKIRLVIPKRRNVGSCSGATNSKTTDVGTNSNTISLDKKDVNEIVTESRPREIGIDGDGDSCKKATGTSKNDALAIPTSTGVKKISMGPSLKDTSKEVLRGSKFKGDGLHEAHRDSQPCQVDNCNVEGGFFQVCGGHMWSFGVSVNGKPSTYCHSCHLFQNVEDFDEGRHSCKNATGTSKNDALAIPTSTGLKKISMGPSLKDTSKEDLRGSKFKGDGCMMFQNISDFDPGSRICKGRAMVEKEDAPECYPGSTDEALHSSKLLKLTEEMHSSIADMGTQLVRLAEDTERMQQDIEQTQQLVLKGNKKLREEVQTSNKRLREDMERRYANLQKSFR